MFHSMNQSRHDLKARLDFAQQSFDHRLSQLESAQELQRHQLHARATRALEEAEERYQAHVKQLQKQLEMERSSSSAAHYHIEKLRKTLKELREELEEKSQEASEVAVLRETCRHLRDSLRDEQRTSQRVPELQRQLEEAQAAQKKLQEKLRKAERAERPQAEATYASSYGWSAPSSADMGRADHRSVAQPALPQPGQLAPGAGGLDGDAAFGAGWEGYEGYNDRSGSVPSMLAPDTSTFGSGLSGYTERGPGPLAAGTEGSGFGAWEGYEGYSERFPSEVHWAQQDVEGAPSEAWPSEAAPQVKEKKKRKAKDKKAKKEEEQQMDFPSAPAEPAGGESVEETIRMLKDMGFDDENRIRVVLEAVGNDVEKAVPVLLSDH